MSRNKYTDAFTFTTTVYSSLIKTLQFHLLGNINIIRKVIISLLLIISPEKYLNLNEHIT